MNLELYKALPSYNFLSKNLRMASWNSSPFRTEKIYVAPSWVSTCQKFAIERGLRNKAIVIFYRAHKSRAFLLSTPSLEIPFEDDFQVANPTRTLKHLNVTFNSLKIIFVNVWMALSQSWDDIYRFCSRINPLRTSYESDCQSKKTRMTSLSESRILCDGLSQV